MVGDAVVVWWAGDIEIMRVIAVTPDGRRIVKTPIDLLKMEDVAGEWPKVGTFRLVKRLGLCSWYLKWEFVAQ